MSAKWLRIESNFVDHFKIGRLAKQLGGSVPEAGWFCMRALSWFSQFCPTGHVAGQHRDSDAAELERFCKWGGAPGKLFAAMLAVGLIDDEEGGGFGYHDWPEYQGKVSASAEKERTRKAKWRAEKAARESAELDLSRDVSHGTEAGRPALRDVTGRDGTGRSSSYEDDGKPPSPACQFFDRFQALRVEGGWAREKAPSRVELDEWFGSVSVKLGDTIEGTTEALRVATRGYSKDPYWIVRALPWAGFVEQWARHVCSDHGQQSIPLGVLGAVP